MRGVGRSFEADSLEQRAAEAIAFGDGAPAPEVVDRPWTSRYRPGPRRAVAVAYVIAMFMGAMDTQIVNVALPTLSREFRAPTASIQWTVIGYILSLAVWIPASGWIGDRLGTRRTFLFALAVFTVASALCGQATTVTELVIFRILQGTGGGMLTPVGMAMLYRTFPPSERARMVRILMFPILVAPAMAPLVGGIIIDNLSWRWVFNVNVPVGIVAFAFSAAFLVEHREPARGRFDFAGFLLSGVGLALGLYALSEGALVGWTRPNIVTTALVGIVLVSIFAVVELRRRDPILKIRLLGDRLFRATNLVAAFGQGGFLGMIYLTPIFLQEALGLSAFRSGITTFVEAIGVFCSSQTVGRLYGRLGPRKMLSTGLTGLFLVSVSFLLIGDHTNLWIVRLAMFLGGYSFGMVGLPTQTAMFATIAPEDSGDASALTNTQRQISVAFSIAIISTVLTRTGGHGLGAFHAAYLVIGVLALFGLLSAVILVHDADAASTMVRKRP